MLSMPVKTKRSRKRRTRALGKLGEFSNFFLELDPNILHSAPCSCVYERPLRDSLTFPSGVKSDLEGSRLESRYGAMEEPHLHGSNGLHREGT